MDFIWSKLCVFYKFFKPKVVLYGGFSEFVYSNFRSKITLEILCFFYVQFDRRPHGSCTCPRIIQSKEHLHNIHFFFSFLVLVSPLHVA